MIDAVSAGAPSSALNRSVEALSELLMDSVVKNLDLARRLTAAAAETTVQAGQDLFLGTRIDTSA
jgi:hypothetical protein